MLIGVPKEIKTHEYRVGLTPESVRQLVQHGHRVVVEKGAGAGLGASDADYEAAGAAIAATAAEVFADAELIVKINPSAYADAETRDYSVQKYPSMPHTALAFCATLPGIPHGQGAVFRFTLPDAAAP